MKINALFLPQLFIFGQQNLPN